jgi:ribonucleoside-diphosphate reductase alpha chain
MDLEDLKKNGEAPDWMQLEGFATLKKGYLYNGETPKHMYHRVANSAAKYLKKPELADKFFKYMWNNWLCPATPVLSNAGTDRGLTISCYGSHVGDSVLSIMDKAKEAGLLLKHGGGLGMYAGRLRGKGSPIGGDNGVTDGIVPFLKIYEAIFKGISQGGTRRGSGVICLPIDHPEAEEFMDLRKEEDELEAKNRDKALSINFHQAMCLDDEFMDKCFQPGNTKERQLWQKLLKVGHEAGEPYITWIGNANKQVPECYKANGLKITHSQLCLTGDTEVLTKSGPVPIQDLVGQVAEIWDGSNWVKNSLFSMTSESSEILEIKLRDGSLIKCTPYHKFYIDGKEVLARDLKPKDLLDYSIPSKDFGVPATGAYLKGFLIAEGTHSKDRPILWLYDRKYSCADRLIKSTEEVQEGRKNTNVLTRVLLDDAGTNRKRLSGLSIRKEELLPWTTTYKREFPLEVYTWNSSSQSEFLAGLFDGDGTVVKSGESRCYQIASIHKPFLEGLRDFLKIKGVYSSLAMMRKAGKCDFKDGYGEYQTKDAYRLTISNISARVLSSLVSFSRLPNFDPSFKGYETRTPRFRQVLEVKKLDKKEPVYCTTVKSTHKFLLGNGVLSGNCNEIYLYSDPDHTFVCCLSSLNLARWEEWKDTDLVETAIWFLDGIMEEFIQKAKDMPGLEAAVRFALKSRALGLGVVGYHTLLQSKMIPFESFQATLVNAEVFKAMDERSLKATQDLAKEYGEPEWCKGFGIRNTHRLAIAPTFSNALISGGVSQGIEPITSNIFSQNTAKGMFIRKNKQLQQLLASKGKDTMDVWMQINDRLGSVSQLDFLDPEEKAVFATAREISQFTIVRQTAQRQKHIDQGQSMNLFYPAPKDITNEEDRVKLGRYIHDTHKLAYQLGVKGRYYMRSAAVLSGDKPFREEGECLSCEG